MGSGRFSGYSCVKFVFFIFNVMFWLLGCAILGIGIWLHISKGSYASIAPSFNFLSATALCIAAGAIVLVVGFFGCCGAIMENPCMLLTYFLLVVAIFVMEIVAGILAFVFREEVEKLLKKELQVGIKTRYNLTDEQGLKEAWDAVQRNLQCCGVNNYTDWYKAGSWSEKNWVPASCCRPGHSSQSANCGQSGNPSDWHTRGCFEELKFWLKTNLYIVGVVGISIGVIQYFCMVLLIFLLEITGAVVMVVNRKQVDMFLNKELRAGIIDYYNNTGQEGITYFWTHMQTQYNCCGVAGPYDWESTKHGIPDSCINRDTGLPHSKGCLLSLKQWTVDNMAPLIAIATAIVLLQILGMTASMGMFCYSRNLNKKYLPVNKLIIVDRKT